jgi:predicted RNA-binding Zn-ribbon protein involved in translation (DUF1610 family)
MTSDNYPGTKPAPRFTNKSILLFLFLMMLVMSSGSVIYVDTPIFYYGILGIGVLMIIIVAYTFYYVTRGKQELFHSEEYGSMDSDSEPDTGLERVFKAEQSYKNRPRKQKPKSRTYRTRSKQDKNRVKAPKVNDSEKMKHSKKELESPEVRKKVDKRKKSKISGRIGSISFEEGIFKEKVKISGKKDSEDTTEKDSKVTTFLCPTCGSKELFYEAGLISGYKYHCKDCDYIGSFVIEKDFKV